MQFTAQEINKLITDPFLTPATLSQAIWPDGNNRWIPAKFLVFLSRIIAKELLKGGARLIISLPPRHGKSTLISQVTIPWYLNTFPNNDVVLASYNKDQASEFGRKARDIITNNPSLFSINIRKDVKRADKFYTVEGNETNFVGLDGAATGKGAHLLIIDDFIKNLQEAMSPTTKDKIYDGFISNLRTRLENDIARDRKGSIIILATRWWSDDLIGRLLEKDLGVGNWTYISLPAIAEENDIIGRKVGEALFPEKYDIAALNEIKQDFGGNFMWNALFQQTPINDINSLTNGELLQFVEPLNNNEEGSLTKVRMWDLAATEGGGDDTATCLMGRRVGSGETYAMHLATNKYSVTKVENWVKETAERDRHLFGNVTVLIEQEPGSSGIALIEHYKNNVLKGFNVEAVPTGGKSKVVRAQPMIGASEYGKLLYYKGVWNAKYKSQYDNFTGVAGGIDDMVDVVSGAYNKLNNTGASSSVYTGRVSAIDMVKSYSEDDIVLLNRELHLESTGAGIPIY